jgi:hypothetical protein
MLKHQYSSLQVYSPEVPLTATDECDFVEYSLDGKEASLVTVSIDDTNKLLWVTGNVSSPGMTLDLLQLKVFFTCSPHTAETNCVHCLQFVETGNRPKDISKIRKLCTSQEVVTAGTSRGWESSGVGTGVPPPPHVGQGVPP